MSLPETFPKDLHVPSFITHFAGRGWVLAALFLILLAVRALTDSSTAPLRPEWLVYVAAAILLRLWAGTHLGEHGNTAKPEADRLIRTGPYRLSRNPLYVANILTSAGLIFFANALPLAVELSLLMTVVVHHVFLVRHEERVLPSLFGESYERYRKDVPRWVGLPRPRGSDPDGSEKTKNKKQSGGVTLQALLRRQGRNVLYTLGCVVVLWIAAR